MEKYEGDDGNRIYFAYENLVEEETGPDEAVRLAKFLEGGLRANAVEVLTSLVEIRHDVGFGSSGGDLDQDSIDRAVEEATKTMVKIEDVPCVWNEVVRNELEIASRFRNRRLQNGEARRLPDVGSDGGTWSLTERPFTPEDLASISQMLLELMNRWSRHQRLLNMLARYHREVNMAYLEAIGQWEYAVVEQSHLIGDQSLELPVADPRPTPRPFHIIQASPHHAGSTLVTNWLMGLFEPEADYAFMINQPDLPIYRSGHEITIDSSIITKTHNLDLLYLYKLYRPQFEELFFVVSNRGIDRNTRINAELCTYRNVLCVEYEELLYSNREELELMVAALTDKLRSRFEFFFGPDSIWFTKENQLNAVERLVALARASADMANEPFEKMDYKFGIHGGLSNTDAMGGVMDSSAAVDAMGDSAAVIEENSDNQRRRLSVSLPDGGCEITWPQRPKGFIQTSYAASYPGCGARMTWNLVEALTGLWTGDDWDNNNRGKQVVTVKTHYPHDAGRLVGNCNFRGVLF